MRQEIFLKKENLFKTQRKIRTYRDLLESYSGE